MNIYCARLREILATEQWLNWPGQAGVSSGDVSVVGGEEFGTFYA